MSDLKRGCKALDPAKHARFKTATDYGFSWPTPEYPIDKTGGLTDIGMGGNGPDPTLSVNGGNPMGNCGPNAIPKNAGETTAAIGGVAETAWTSDRVSTLYALYEALTATPATDWRPTGAWVLPSELDAGVDLGDWLLWLATHDEAGNQVAVGSGLIDGFVKLGLHEMEQALAAADAVVVGVNLNPQADAQFQAWQEGNGPGWDLSDTDQPDPNDGHAIILGAAQSPTGPYKWGSWGAFVPSTQVWRGRCPQQAFAVLTKEACESASIPYAQIAADLEALGGTVADMTAPPAPSDPPPPGTTPGNVPPVIPAPPGPMPTPQHASWWQRVLELLEEFGIKVGDPS